MDLLGFDCVFFHVHDVNFETSTLNFLKLSLYHDEYVRLGRYMKIWYFRVRDRALCSFIILIFFTYSYSECTPWKCS